ncbi:MAG: SDR family oxidoreductase [Anaerolineae bacterium]|nr:SDR family oxidoreductase [Anaerolineae bacterium]
MDNRIGQTSLVNQVALITGSGRGLGRAVALALAAAGMRVAILARSTDEVAETATLIRQAGGQVLSFTMDVTDQPAVEQMIKTVEHNLGPIDLLINNAAVVHPLGPVWSVDPDEWWQSMNINLRGPFLCTRSVLPGMIARHKGRIINVSSGAGMETVPNWSAYITSKAALIRLTELIAAETKAYGITVLAIDPGPVRTAMTVYVMESDEGQQWMPQFRRIFDEKRDVTPERVVELVLFIASGQADPLSGRYFSVTHNLPKLVKDAASIIENEQYTLRLRL